MCFNKLSGFKFENLWLRLIRIPSWSWSQTPPLLHSGGKHSKMGVCGDSHSVPLYLYNIHHILQLCIFFVWSLHSPQLCSDSPCLVYGKCSLSSWWKRIKRRPGGYVVSFVFLLQLGVMCVCMRISVGSPGKSLSWACWPVSLSTTQYQLRGTCHQ